MGLARLYNNNRDHIFFKSTLMKKILYYSFSDELANELLCEKVNLDGSLNNEIMNKEETKINIYGYPYNVPGFEIMYIQNTFGEQKTYDQALNFLNTQMKITFNSTDSIFQNHCFDKVTINYRIYEFYRYLECIYED